ncbi:coiled-coil domain-containing protein 178 [Channa argus]|uniref:coiled-coil domain-containing protein 178 n=1 Tax=Channa argus TaxID=215402 RepID=UPI003521B888
MPDVKPLRFPSREAQSNPQDQADLQLVCTGRRRTCALLNSPLPCVNNAIYHIREIRMTVESWFQQYGKNQLHIDQEKKYSKTLRLQSKDSDTESVTSTELFVEGISISARESSPLLKKINDVLVEVVYLIERLEADRQYAEEAILKEKRRKRFLENKVDSISLWKQKEHALVVQKEHDASIRDITELKWQLKVERGKTDHIQDKLSHTELLNQQLHENITFFKKQIPIVNENLGFQRGIIKEINTAQEEADEVYLSTQRHLVTIQKEFEKMEQDANNERKSLDNVLLALKSQLANRINDLNQLMKLDEGLCAEKKEAEKTITLTEQKCTTMMQYIPELMEREKTEKEQILQLKVQIDDEIQNNSKLKKKLIALREDIVRTKREGEAEVSGTQLQLQSKHDAFAPLRKENIEYEQNIEDYKTKISESKKAVKQMREERKQMLQKIIDNDEQWEKAKEEVTQVIAQHSVTQAKLEEQEQLTFMEDQKARKEIESLRKDLKGQMTTLQLLKDQCANIEEERIRQQRSSALTNEKLQKEFKESSLATKALETKIENIKKLTTNLERIQSEHRNTLLSLEREKKLKHDYLKAAQNLHTATIKRYDNTLGKISDITKKTNEYQDAAAKMEKIFESMPEATAELESVFDVVDFKNKSAALIMSTLQSDINNCQQRTQRSMQTHTAHFMARKKEMGKTKEALKMALGENKRLSEEYENLKKVLMEARQKAVTALSKKNHEHKSFHYYRQLSLLQKRMHKALVKYFKQRSIYSQAELDRCQALSQETNQKIKTAQDGLSEEIQLISVFLQSLTDDSTTTDDDARRNKQASSHATVKMPSV